MKNIELAKRIKGLRKRKGFSQEELSEDTGLSLRTIQRIENGETEPRGDSLRRLANSFDVSPEEIVDWTIQEDTGFLKSLNLSALSFFVFPLLGILVPLIIWISKKDKIRDVNKVAKSILNFQITWTIFLFIGYFSVLWWVVYEMKVTGDVNVGLISAGLKTNLVFICLMYLYNLVFVLFNTFRINKEKDTRYFPKIHFIRTS